MKHGEGMTTLWLNNYRAQGDQIFAGFVAFMLMIQPFIDNYYLMTEPQFKIAGITIVTLIRYGLIFLLTVFVLLRYRSKNIFITLVVLCGVVLLYSYLHISARDGLEISSTIDKYSNFAEISYIVAIVAPLVLVVVIIGSNLSFNQVVTYLSYASCLIAGIIVVSNITLTGLSSYSNRPIKANIFSWFASNLYEFSELSTKGFFYFANQISALLCFLMPFVIYRATHRKGIIEPLTIILMSFAMVMIGTRIAYYGALALLFSGLFLAIILGAWKREINVIFSLALVVSLLFVILVYPYSPMLKRSSLNQQITEAENREMSKAQASRLFEITKKIKTEQPSDKQLAAFENGIVEPMKFTREEKLFYLEYELEGTRIQEQFYDESYPYQHDPDFWILATKLPVESQMDNRMIERAMIERVLHEGNPTPSVYLFGMGASRLEGIFNIEEDFVKQSYSLGYVGIGLFFAVYFVPVLLIILLLLKGKINKNNIAAGYAIGVGFSVFFLASYKSGNCLDSLTNSIYLAVVTGVVIKEFIPLLRKDTSHVKDAPPVNDGHLTIDAR